MAQNLQLLKRRIKTAKNISQVARAMEMISASKIKRAQAIAENNKPYTRRIISLTERIIKTADLKKYYHPFINRNNSGKKMFILVSPDRGLIGSLNTELFRKVANLHLQDSSIITIGNKAQRFVAKNRFNLVASFPMGGTFPKYNAVYKLIAIIEEYYLKNNVDEVVIVYTDFESFFSQKPVVKNILPLDFGENEEINEPEDQLPYIFEPNVSEILNALLPHYLEVQLFSALIEAYTSEQAARMIAMQNAKNNALEIASYLTLAYNKSRQERITNEILDITNTSVI